MGDQPKSQREALLIELCVQGGYCSNDLTVDELSGDLSADEITVMILRREDCPAEGRDLVMGSSAGWDEVARMVNDWLFDPRGRGVSSGLPR